MPPSTEITLSTSRTLGLVAIASGENYPQASQALEAAGFSRLSNGAYTASLADAQAARHTASALVHRAHERGATLVTSSRPYLGDVGIEIAARLPGTWNAEWRSTPTRCGRTISGTGSGKPARSTRPSKTTASRSRPY
ncbi:hypothetical protein [Streptomyces sp. bgisy034]|uniref:hypothetical protein n=1 Tax=Streptomyces sp. bgisy034 TaxID=3413774 RepID=UPI003EB85A41